MTDEQKANFGKMLADTKLTKDITAASDVQMKPAPNDPTPIEKARDIAKDLQQKSGVEMDK